TGAARRDRVATSLTVVGLALQPSPVVGAAGASVARFGALKPLRVAALLIRAHTSADQVETEKSLTAVDMTLRQALRVTRLPFFPLTSASTWSAQRARASRFSSA